MEEWQVPLEPELLFWILGAMPITVALPREESNIFTSVATPGMARIESRIEVDAPVDRVWEVVSDIDSEPRFWKGTKGVRNIFRDGNTVEREITIAFRDQKCLQTVTLTPKERIEAVFTRGIIDGTKVVTVAPMGEKTALEVAWDIRLTGMMGMFTGMVKRHVEGGTEQALRAIKEEIEG